VPVVSHALVVLTAAATAAARRETEPGWDEDIREEVLEECSKYGPVHHIAVDAASAGHVFVKFATAPAAQATQVVMHGRFFAGQMITVKYLTEEEYTARFPAAAAAETPVVPQA
jgi:RNA-binding protein 39